MRARRIAGVVMLGIGLVLTAGPPNAQAADPLPPLVTTLEAVTDAAADDIFVEPPAQEPAQGATPPPPVRGQHPRADITQASLEYAPGWIRMKVQVKNPINPLKDPAWSDRSDAEWALDTNGDGQLEYTVEFATDEGQLYGAVFDVAKPEDSSVCEADSASFSPEDGYTLVIDPKCIGNPGSVGYAVAVFIDTDPKDERVPLATDRVPDVGFKQVAAPARPGEAPGRVPAAAGTPTAPAAAPPASGPTPARSTPPPGSSVRGGSTPRPTPDAASPDAGAVSPSTSVSGQPAPPAPPASPLARTGSGSATRALFGLGILLVGAGLLVMTQPAKRMAGAGF